MSGLLGTPNNRQVTKYTGLQVQTSALNIPVAIFWGKRRLAWNLIWQGDFKAHKHSSGGKGGGGKGASSYTYTVAVIMALGEGVVGGIGTVWSNQSTTSLSALGLTLFGGSPTQTPWSYMTSAHPSQALSYANTAYLACSALDLGSNPTLPQIDFEAISSMSGTMPGTVDVNLADVIPDLLTNTRYGMGFSSVDIDADDLAAYKAYNQAQGLFFSPALISQEKATDIIDRWALLSNSWIFWSADRLKLVPLGDSALSANGATYAPVTTIQYDLTVADFIGSPPVDVKRIDPADAPNRTVIQITDRALAYNSNPIEYKDQTLVDQYGLRDNSSQQADEIADAAVGLVVANLIGQRAAYQRNTYSFTLPYKFVRLEPGDLVTLTDPNNGAITQLPVRIKTIDEDENFNLAITAEEYFGNATMGTAGTAPVQPSSPNTFNRLTDPGNVNTPCVLEPSSALTNGTAQVWIAASGGADWGGALVYLSFDGTTFTPVGSIVSSARQGKLTAALASHTDPDSTDTLSVDLTESLGTLDPVTNADADAFRTLAYLSAPASGAVLAASGELVAYGAVASTGTYSDNLTYLRRGLYGTSPAAHATNDLFTRLDLGASDTTIVKYDLPTQYIGATIYLKFVSFNIYGQAAQDISAVTAYTYTPSGAGYGGGTAGVPTTPTGLSATPATGYNSLSWTANPSSDNVTLYQVWRANGLSAAFGSASKIGSSSGTSYLDSTAAAATAYTYFLVAVNAVGSSANSAGVNVTSGASSLVFATAAEVQAGSVGSKAIAPDHLQTAALPQTLTDGATISTWDMSVGFNAKVTLAGTGRTLSNPTNSKEGVTYRLEIIQDATGSRTITTWPSSFDFGGAGTPTLSTGASKHDFVFLDCYDASTPKFRASFNKGS